MIPSMLAYWGADLRCRFANRAYSVWFGIDGSNVVGMSISDLLGEELFVLNEPYIKGALAGRPQTFERAIKGPDGVVRHSLVHYIPDVVDGRVLGFVAHATEVSTLKDRHAALQSVINSLEAEVTRHRLAEEGLSADQHRLEKVAARMVGEKERFEAALHDATKLLEALKESVVDHIAVLDQDGTVTATNSAWREFAELCDAHVYGSPPRSDVGTNYVGECRAAARLADSDAARAADGIAAVLAGGQDLFTLEYGCTAVGDERWFHMSVTRLQTPRSGAVIVHADITPGRMQRVRERESGAGLGFVD
jgi:PAS domain S-box-containing protein